MDRALLLNLTMHQKQPESLSEIESWNPTSTISKRRPGGGLRLCNNKFLCVTAIGGLGVALWSPLICSILFHEHTIAIYPLYSWGNVGYYEEYIHGHTCIYAWVGRWINK